jgi:hypothetical protein
MPGPTEANDSIQYHTTQEDSIMEEDFLVRWVESRLKMNKRKRLARKKQRRRAERAKAS